MRGIERKKLVLVIIIVVILILSPFMYIQVSKIMSKREINLKDVISYISKRKDEYDAVLVMNDSYMVIAATPYACWYDIGKKGNESYGLRPLLISQGVLDRHQHRLLRYLDVKNVLSIGNKFAAGLNENSYQGNIEDICINMAMESFEESSGAIIVKMSFKSYILAVSSAHLSSYLNIPIFFVKSWDNSKVNAIIKRLNCKYLIFVGDDAGDAVPFYDLPYILINSKEKAFRYVLEAVNERFGRIDYVVYTNPSDIISERVIEENMEVIEDKFENLKLVVLGRDANIVGDDERIYDIDMPDGIVHLKILVEITSLYAEKGPIQKNAEVEPIIRIELNDDGGNLLSHAPNFAYEKMKCYVETLSVNAPGKVKLHLSMYYGTKGAEIMGFPGGTGYSRISADYRITLTYTYLKDAHLPLVIGASSLAPYLAAIHGGAVIADENAEMGDDSYVMYASGSQTNPSYNPALQENLNSKVENNSKNLEEFLKIMDEYDAIVGNGTLYNVYINGDAYLAILADTNMIPMYYYEPGSEEEYPWGGLGLPGDNIYTMNFTLSSGRVLGINLSCISTLISRTIFYEKYATGYAKEIKDKYSMGNDYLRNYFFLFGEGGGQTGFIFWQREFSREVEQHGFHSEQYGYNYNNDRQSMEKIGAYERANYFEFMLHGNWYWYVPELNGVDIYSTSVKNTDIYDWNIGPGTILTAACLMGRVDGIPSCESIALHFLNAGLNAFVGSTRSTGSESGTRWMEWNLLYNDTSVGVAVKRGKIDNPRPPTIYVRTLYGDPAFNPYEPENGFSDQCRPVLI